MNDSPVTVQRALISVSDKSGLAAFAAGLHAAGIEILSTGGTATHLRGKGIPVTDVSAVTAFPEMMEGRLKTLHPMIHGGILGLRDRHAEEAKAHGIGWIDLVVVNLYPFAETVQDPAVTLDLALENIDIGGPTMIRSAAKNRGWVGVVVDPEDYPRVLQEIHSDKTLSVATRSFLSAKAFMHTAQYDALIAEWLTGNQKTVSLQKKSDLRYGENPHQAASVWQMPGKVSGVLGAQMLQGKPLSYNNLVDADAAFACVRDFSEPACVIVKHATPCGVAMHSDADAVFPLALSCDPVSAFGGIAAFNRPCTAKMAEGVSGLFMEVVLAPAFTQQALDILAKKPLLRVLQIDFSVQSSVDEMKYIEGGMLIQTRDNTIPNADMLKTATENALDEALIPQLLFAAKVVKHVKSNAIVLANDFTAVGIGGGQVSRVDAVTQALQKAGERREGAVLASDAFFPFRDSIDRLAGSGIRAIIQPGGSVRDPEVIAACEEHGIAMVFTGRRSFKH